MIAIPWIYVPMASKLGLRPSNSLAMTAHFISWNDAIISYILLIRCRMLFLLLLLPCQIFLLQKICQIVYGFQGGAAILPYDLDGSVPHFFTQDIVIGNFQKRFCQASCKSSMLGPTKMGLA